MNQTDDQSQLANENSVEVWLRMYEEEMHYARHHEVLRFHSTSVIVVISAALIAYFGSTEKLTTETCMVGLFLILANILGVLISIRHYERNRRHAAFYSAYRTQISRMTHTTNQNFPSIDCVRKKAKKCHRKSTIRWVTKRLHLKIYQLWCCIHVLLILIGIILLSVGATASYFSDVTQP